MKQLSVFILLLAMAFPVSTNAASLIGDVDGNGKVSIDDVTTLINYLLTNDASHIVFENADVESDGRISIDDVTGLINKLLTQNNDPQPVEHEWVDLGLPSGTLWATCNVGATSPEEYGDYFAWGETEPKDLYNWSTYKWCMGSASTLTKYCTISTQGTVDNKTELDPEDDAAYVNWGPQWRMPSYDQLRELVTQCTWMGTTRNGVDGLLATGPNGNTLFLPAAGDFYNSWCSAGGSNMGYYWSNTLHPLITDYFVSCGCAYGLEIILHNADSAGAGIDSLNRMYGRSIRAVFVQ